MLKQTYGTCCAAAFGVEVAGPITFVATLTPFVTSFTVVLAAFGTFTSPGSGASFRCLCPFRNGMSDVICPPCKFGLEALDLCWCKVEI